MNRKRLSAEQIVAVLKPEKLTMRPAESRYGFNSHF